MNIDLLLDSGAYSAFTRGCAIDLEQYIRFLRRHHAIKNYVSLDHIPGAHGIRSHDPRAAQRSYNNFQAMKDGGLEPWAVHHRQDDESWLERYLNDGVKRICLAPHPIQHMEVTRWLRACFKLIPSSVTVHVLGITTASILQHFPRITSVDSSSYFQMAANGNIVVPISVGETFDFRVRPRVITVSDKSPERPNHFDRLSPWLQRKVYRWLQHCGTTLAEVRTSKPSGKAARMRTNIPYYQGLSRATNIKVYYVSIVYDPKIREALRACGVREQLLSYADLQNDVAGMIKYVWGKW